MPELSKDTGTQLWPRALILSAGLAAAALVASRLSYIPIWDGRMYADCIVRAAESPPSDDTFRCIGHTSQAFVALAALVQLIDTGNAALLLALFLRNVDVRGVLGEIARASPAWLLLSLSTMFANLAVRAWRWQYLLEPLGRPGFWRAFRATAVGFAANGILPARLTLRKQ